MKKFLFSKILIIKIGNIFLLLYVLKIFSIFNEEKEKRSYQL